MLAAIEAARESVCLETYIYAADYLGEQISRGAGPRPAAGRAGAGAGGRPGLDGFAGGLLGPLRAAGGEVRQFNPLALDRLGIRDHRKLLVCDGRVAFVGGFNIASEYDGDGVTRGWCDLGLRLGGPLAAQLAAAFEEMFARADFQHKRFMRCDGPPRGRRCEAADEQLLLSGPGRGTEPDQAGVAARSGARARTCRSWCRISFRRGGFGGTWRAWRGAAGGCS